ncbi:MAG: CCA tRNA nucleotidyltransferase [Dissulfurimicrobium sp.]|uniref:CCA tRNA nucleotidyltransferase n=1 Tax=Dissulfurimicrobium sp. TaxID=2022436 RepID=UPI004049B9E7
MSETRPDMSLILNKLQTISQTCEIYIVGGSVRDWLLDRECADIDLVLPKGAIKAASRFARLTGGAFVPLDVEEGVARVVFPGLVFDFSQFRHGAATIHEDLKERDFTINAMAFPLDKALCLLNGAAQAVGKIDTSLLIDPTGGLHDLKNGIIRAISLKNFQDDPLRSLRAYRFRAQLDFEMEGDTARWISAVKDRLPAVSPERISHELRLIMETKRAARTCFEMLDNGILFVLFPELCKMNGVRQPGFHHLDVLGHSLEALSAVEGLLSDPCLKFILCGPLKDWTIQNSMKAVCLKWAALFHDAGKPACKGEKDGRVTFYHHDETGAKLLEGMGMRFRWSRREIDFIARLVRLHMRPFHLLNDLRRGGPSLRAMRRLVMEIEADYPALFLLAMADSLAGCGPLKPPDLDFELALLWEKVHGFYTGHLTRLRQKQRLLTGHDVTARFGLKPGPLIGKALDAIEEARLEGIVNSRDEAFSFLETWLKSSVPSS